MRASERPIPVAPPIPLRPRRTWAAAGIAAALVAVVIGGAVVLRATSAATTTTRASSSCRPSAAVGRRCSRADAAATTAPAATAAGGSATTAGGRRDGGRQRGDRRRRRRHADDDGAGTHRRARGHAPAPALTVLASPDDLVAFAMEATPQTPPPGACTGGRYVAPASYAGVTPAVTVEVFVDGADAVARDASVLRRGRPRPAALTSLNGARGAREYARRPWPGTP